VVTDRSNFLAARVALSDDANGRIQFAGFVTTQNPNDAMRLDLPIVNGVIGGVAIPEPATVVLACVSLVGLVALTRQSRPFHGCL
jgi:hypothetical protein